MNDRRAAPHLFRHDIEVVDGHTALLTITGVATTPFDLEVQIRGCEGCYFPAPGSIEGRVSEGQRRTVVMFRSAYLSRFSVTLTGSCGVGTDVQSFNEEIPWREI